MLILCNRVRLVRLVSECNGNVDEDESIKSCLTECDDDRGRADESQYEHDDDDDDDEVVSSLSRTRTRPF